MQEHYDAMARFVSAKSSSLIRLHNAIRSRYLSNTNEPDEDDLQFLNRDYIVHIVEFFVLLAIYDMYRPDAMRGYAEAVNDQVQETLDELWSSDIPDNHKRALERDLTRRRFSPISIERMEREVVASGKLEQRPIFRFLSGHMSEPYARRGMSDPPHGRFD